jgi:hypothetical protein
MWGLGFTDSKIEGKMEVEEMISDLGFRIWDFGFDGVSMSVLAAGLARACYA